MLKNIVSLFLIFFLVTGCANMSSWSPPHMTDREQTIFQGNVVGVIGGGTIGALLGQLLCKNTECTVIGAALGMFFGAILGNFYGRHVADLKEKFSNDEDYLKACIATSKEANRQAELYNAQLKANIAYYRKEVRSLIKQYNQRQVRVATLYQEKQKLDNMIAQHRINRQAIYEQIAKFQQARHNAQSASAGQIKALDQEINKLEKAADELEQQTQTLASINQSIKL